MAYLKFYRIEDNFFNVENKLILTDKETKKIIKKLTQHFKFQVKEIKFFGHGRNWSITYEKLSKLRLNHNSNLLSVLHELAHLYIYQKFTILKYNELEYKLKNNSITLKDYSEQFKKLKHKKCHNKQLTKVIIKFSKYCKLKNYWNISDFKFIYNL